MIPIRTVEISVGVFMLAGITAFIFLALKVSGFSFSNSDSYAVYAEFENIAGLNKRARVSVGGVTVGRVTDIVLDKKNYMAKVAMNIEKNIDNIPIDSAVAIMTSGLLGEKYISISIGSEKRYLKSGDYFSDTQSAIILENLIGKFLLENK